MIFATLVRLTCSSFVSYICGLVAWCSASAFHPINEVTLHHTGL